ncbi:M24 family metallopeptidase [Knoellia sp. 3-2P3]|uniref:M24 family metallopeptidase n=1 Tax=unclassified Knoellia TaxID=2618719 RepID=UPI0023D9E0E0|nr:M24 family metallopeptidase [Knoellia sp. 3-2P3]MDF2091247.1 M24 family metallopeptidase [Knoellia sp. 3-2P3]
MADAAVADTREAALARRLTALTGVARDAGVDRLLLREPATLAWLLEARVHVPQTLESACLDVVVDLGGDEPALRVVCNAIEAPRLRDTELADLPVEWDVVPWWTPRDERLPSGPGVGADRQTGGSVDVSAAVTALRRVLDDRQQGLLAEVSRDAAAAATRAALRLTPRVSEYAAAGTFAAELLAAGLDPVVLMVGGGERPGVHRHPLPTDAPLGERAMLVCCARRHGLIASVTRVVAFGRLDAERHDSYRRLLEVERAFLDASRPGTRLGEAFSAGTAAYADHGFAADEWHHHHQGGLSGFTPRDFPAHAGSDDELATGSVVAWNPSADGLKVEDTAVVRADGPEVLVHDPDWPSLQVGGRSRPDVLVR